MSRISQAFMHKARIAYLTVGDGGGKSLDYFLALVEGGANLLEIGFPYSDPIADGPVIQQAMQRALTAHTTIDTGIEIIRNIRKQSQVAMIVFSYYNPIQQDLQQFLEKIKEAGADGILIIDLPYEEASKYHHYCRCLQLEVIHVIAPSTDLARMKQILFHASDGFVYYACHKGTTGTRATLPKDLAEHLLLLRQATKLPIAVGFGVASLAMIQQILALADGCVVGSYLVRLVEQAISPHQLMCSMRELYGT